MCDVHAIAIYELLLLRMSQLRCVACLLFAKFLVTLRPCSRWKTVPRARIELLPSRRAVRPTVVGVACLSAVLNSLYRGTSSGLLCITQWIVEHLRGYISNSSKVLWSSLFRYSGFREDTHPFRVSDCDWRIKVHHQSALDSLLMQSGPLNKRSCKYVRESRSMACQSSSLSSHSCCRQFVRSQQVRD